MNTIYLDKIKQVLTFSALYTCIAFDTVTNGHSYLYNKKNVFFVALSMAIYMKLIIRKRNTHTHAHIHTNTCAHTHTRTTQYKIKDTQHNHYLDKG